MNPEPPHYTIILQGHLDPRWQEWFDGMEMLLLPNGQTRIYGPVTDQPALFALLSRVRDLGLPLLLVMHSGLDPDGLKELFAGE